MAMVVRDCCPECGSRDYKKNGHTHSGKQNYRCNICGREFVMNLEPIIISTEKRELIKQLLLERIPLRGICRTVGVSMKWLVEFITETYSDLPDHVHVRLVEQGKDVIIQTRGSEVEALWSGVGSPDNQQGGWSAMDGSTRPIIAFYVGDKSRESAKKLWQHIPDIYRDQATFYTDQHAAYAGVIPAQQHRAVTKQSGTVNHRERFNCTLRQRLSRLVRKALSFSKKLANHSSAIK